MLVSNLLDSATGSAKTVPGRRTRGPGHTVLIEGVTRRHARRGSSRQPTHGRPHRRHAPTDALQLLGADLDGAGVDRDRAGSALDALDTLTADNLKHFATIVEGRGLLPRAEALTGRPSCADCSRTSSSAATLDPSSTARPSPTAPPRRCPDLLASLARACRAPAAALGLARMLGQLRRNISSPSSRDRGAGPRWRAPRTIGSLASHPHAAQQAPPGGCRRGSPRNLSSTGPRFSVPSIRPRTTSSR